jgi:hypothetical protein
MAKLGLVWCFVDRFGVHLFSLPCRPVYECLICTIIELLVLVGVGGGGVVSPGAMQGLVVSQICWCPIWPRWGKLAIMVYPGSFQLFLVGVPCGMLSIRLATCSLHSRWATIGFGVAYGNIPCVRVSIKLPLASVGARSGNMDGWSVPVECIVGLSEGLLQVGRVSIPICLLLRYSQSYGVAEYLVCNGYRDSCLSCILARRSFVGIMSWMTMNHIDFMSSDIQTVCRLCHTFDQLVDGCSDMTHTSRAPLSASVMVCSMIYRRLWNALGASFVSGGVI